MCARIMETNYLGVVRMVQAVLPAMRSRGSGTIVNVSSVAGRVAPPLGGFYAASKFALEGLSEALHYEVGHFGVRVRLVEPGVFATEFQAKEYGFSVTAPYDELEREWANARAALGAVTAARARAGRTGDRRRDRERRAPPALAGR